MGLRVLVEVSFDSRFGGLFDERRTRKVREPLPEVDRPVLIRQPAHLGEY